MSAEANDAVIRALNQATRDWVRHVLGECDPDDCDGTHDEWWYEHHGKEAPR